MKILLFGATGRVGKEVLALALNDGHEVTAFVRSPEKLPPSIKSHKKLQIFTGNILNHQNVQNVISNDFDLIFSALSTDKNNTLSKGIPIIIQAMEKANVDRIVSIGTAGILQARSQPDVYRFLSNESRRKSTTAAEDHLSAYLSLKKSQLNWTIFCPTYLPDGIATEKVVYDLNMLPENTSKITVGNTAWFTYNELFNEKFFKYRVGIGEYE
ncbi:hypothetical protein CR194_00605 [Salipaludibacillus keqinensis]|jgi:uncharacterized protein|uniref:NAD(P)-binding domain-containing protein n=1 Tax=Salipaludibacillus keqinensis TaxID=2045207 RepID=A0A323TIP4_9BACI|nr:NAD(P)H-binding protein [Salipaludibacillus keqinensis]PYZ94076.1 hypothetical protein CR194_00605 [Salipaludibacillus keqinensis]